MATIRFEGKVVPELRDRLRAALQAPKQGHDVLSLCPIDLTQALVICQHLQMRPGHRLTALQFIVGGHGSCRVFSVKDDVAASGEELDAALLKPPLPQGINEDFMAAIAGDGSPQSYLEASLLARELSEALALWHGCSWSDHILTTEDPSADKPYDRRLPAVDALRSERWILYDWPSEWSPVVTMGKVVEVKLYTYSPIAVEPFVMHVDSYVSDSYAFESVRRIIAEASGGPIY